MIKPVDISPINTATHACFHCINCGAKEKITISMINTDNEHEMAMLKEIQCPYCGIKLGESGLPKLNNQETIKLSDILFKGKGQNFPVPFYIDLIFNTRSPHTQSKHLSERLNSFLQFLTDKRDATNDSGIVGEIFSNALKYFLAEGYLNQEEYQSEYDNCVKIWNQFFSKGDE